mmetsp:Transcript_27818/g.65378  ORF Transcript_27818/g.65378 Transcript_27818/m.65378 type:complete len:108 (+) Transcript_27818:4-327(+)
MVVALRCVALRHAHRHTAHRWHWKDSDSLDRIGSDSDAPATPQSSIGASQRVCKQAVSKARHCSSSREGVSSANHLMVSGGRGDDQSFSIGMIHTYIHTYIDSLVRK